MKRNPSFLSFTTLKNTLLLFAFISIYSSSFSQSKYRDLSRRKIMVKTDDDIVESEVYEGIEEKEPKENKTYYWYDHNMIMTTKGGYSGELLHGRFDCQYRNYQLKERGKFSFGLKVGKWRRWYPNGELKETMKYRRGFGQGKYYKYDSLAHISEKGKLRKGKLNGKVYYYAPTGLIATNRYKNGVEIMTSDTPKKANFFTKLFSSDKKKNTKTKEESSKSSKKQKVKSATKKPKSEVKPKQVKANKNNTSSKTITNTTPSKAKQPSNSKRTTP